MNKARITQKLKHLLGERQEVAFALLFGSILEGEAFRDVDVAIYLSPPLEPLDELKYKLDLEVEGERELGIPLDVKILNNAPYPFSFRVLKLGRPLVVKDEDLFARFTEETCLRYMDEGRLYKASLKELEEALAHR